MNLLDENIRDDQRALLQKWGIPFRQIGRDISHKGIEDENLIPFLHRLHRATLFTQDKHFFEQRLCHRAYGLVYLDVGYLQVAEFIRRFLRHPEFRTQAKRLGKVVRVHPDGVQYWQTGRPRLAAVNWIES